MRRPTIGWIATTLVTLACGCRSCDRIESELRAREHEVRELREELERTTGYSQALQLELRGIRGEPAVVTPDGMIGPPVPLYPVRSLALGRQTGGRDGDAGVGDTALQVVLEPRSPDGQVIRVPGAAAIEVLEISPTGLKKPLCSWEIPPEELHRSWRNGLLSTGYTLVLPWKTPPSTNQLRVVAHFRLDDGRLFEADRDVTVRLPTGANKRQPPPEPIPAPQPSDGPVLPPPRPVEPPVKTLPSTLPARMIHPGPLSPLEWMGQVGPRPLAPDVRIEPPVPLP